MQADTGFYSALIPTIGTNTTIHLRIFALDDKGNWGISSNVDIQVRTQPPPLRPTPDFALVVGGILGGVIVGAPLLVGFTLHTIRGKSRKPRNSWHQRRHQFASRDDAVFDGCDRLAFGGFHAGEGALRRPRRGAELA